MRWKMGGAFRKQQKVLLPFVVAWPGVFVMMEDTAEERKEMMVTVEQSLFVCFFRSIL